MFKDTPEGSTHHDEDDCIKCKVCDAHYTDIRCGHIPPNAVRTGDSGRVSTDLRKKLEKTGWWSHLETLGERSLDEFIGMLESEIQKARICPHCHCEKCSKINLK